MSQETCTYQPIPASGIQCKDLANEESCNTMIRMAMRESKRNFANYAYFASSPACFMYQQMADRGIEAQLQDGQTENKCYVDTPFPKDGSWTSQLDQTNDINNAKSVPACFDAVTRPR
jgi:hypothetical protein